MVFEQFNEVYIKFKMHFYKRAFRKTKSSKASLTTVETFCMEVIHGLGRPSISEFADFVNISSANAADKVNNLIKKGYIKKVQSIEDKRMYYLEVTPQYYENYNISDGYAESVVKRTLERMNDEEKNALSHMLQIMNEEVMNDWNE